MHSYGLPPVAGVEAPRLVSRGARLAAAEARAAADRAAGVAAEIVRADLTKKTVELDTLTAERDRLGKALAWLKR